MLGHAFPVYYKFKGGKAFIAGAATLFAVDYRIGLILLVLFLVLVFAIKYMSVASCLNAALAPLGLALVNIPGFQNSIPSFYFFWSLSILGAWIILLPHIPNFKKLIAGKETKWYLIPPKKKEEKK